MDNIIKTLPILILAGGRGTRLGKLTQNIPKPMVPINGVPFLDILINKIKNSTAGKIYLSVGYLKEQIINHYKNENSIFFLEENTPLGTGGAICNAIKEIKQNYLLCFNADTFFDIDLIQFMVWSLQSFQNYPDLNVTMAITDKIYPGNVTLQEHPFALFNDHSNGSYCNGGIYLLKKSILNQMPTGYFSFESDVLKRLSQKKQLAAKLFTDNFIDIGSPQSYEHAQKIFIVPS